MVAKGETNDRLSDLGTQEPSLMPPKRPILRPQLNVDAPPADKCNGNTTLIQESSDG